MSTWSADELEHLGTADEVTVSSHRPDGALRSVVTIWGVHLGQEVYIRSAYGPDNGWFRRAKAAGTGRISAAGVDREVVFEVPDEADADLHAGLDAAYHAKYDHYGPRIVGSVVGPALTQATLRVLPAN